jgi:hypothetical protein
VNRILAWYRAGINPQDKLPFLATYLTPRYPFDAGLHHGYAGSPAASR